MWLMDLDDEDRLLNHQDLPRDSCWQLERGFAFSRQKAMHSLWGPPATIKQLSSITLTQRLFSSCFLCWCQNIWHLICSNSLRVSHFLGSVVYTRMKCVCSVSQGILPKGGVFVAAVRVRTAHYLFGRPFSLIQCHWSVEAIKITF